MDLAEKNPWYAAGQRQMLTFHSKPSPKEPMFRPSPKEPIFFGLKLMHWTSLGTVAGLH